MNENKSAEEKSLTLKSLQKELNLKIEEINNLLSSLESQISIIKKSLKG